jgi:hypothetical protein
MLSFIYPKPVNNILINNLIIYNAVKLNRNNGKNNKLNNIIDKK